MTAEEIEELERYAFERRCIGEASGRMMVGIEHLQATWDGDICTVAPKPPQPGLALRLNRPSTP